MVRGILETVQSHVEPDALIHVLRRSAVQRTPEIVKRVADLIAWPKGALKEMAAELQIGNAYALTGARIDTPQHVRLPEEGGEMLRNGKVVPGQLLYDYTSILRQEMLKPA